MNRTFALLFCSFICLQGGYSQPTTLQSTLAYTQVQFDADTCCWRALSREGRYEEAALLILEFLHQRNHVVNAQSLRWHAGQLYALDGQYRPAINYCRKTYSVFDRWFGGQDGKAWYCYGRGTVGFLKRNKQRLDRMIRIYPNQGSQDPNLEHLKRLMAHWDKSYREALL